MYFNSLYEPLDTRRCTVWTGAAGMELFDQALENEASPVRYKRIYVKRKMRIMKRRLFKSRYTKRYYFKLKIEES